MKFRDKYFEPLNQSPAKYPFDSDSKNSTNLHI